MEYTVKRTDDSVLTIQHAIRAGWQHTDLLLADVHFDSPYCNRKLLTQTGKVRTERTLHLCIPTLKDEFNLFGGYHVEKGRWPRVIGGYWLKFWYSPDTDTKVEFDAHLAI